MTPPRSATSTTRSTPWRGIGRLERLINDLLDVSRVEAGKLTMDPVPIELGPFVEHVIREIGREHPERAVDMVAGDDAIVAYADAFRVSQVIANLLSNAFKYSPATAPVAVTVLAAYRRSCGDLRPRLRRRHRGRGSAVRVRPLLRVRLERDAPLGRGRPGVVHLPQARRGDGRRDHARVAGARWVDVHVSRCRSRRRRAVRRTQPSRTA